MKSLPSMTAGGFSFKTFGIGLAAVAALYLLLFAYVFVKREATLSLLEEQLTSVAVVIEAPEGGGEHPLEAAPLDPHDLETPAAHGSHAAPAAEDDGRSLAQVLHGSGALPEKGLEEHPVEQFYEKTAAGLLPVHKAGVPTVFEAYRRPALINRSKHSVAVAVVDYGLSDELSKKIVEELPAAVSLILSPYAEDAAARAKAARADGHEVWLELPLQTLDFPSRDPGPKGLMTGSSLAYNQERLEWALTRTTGYAGIAVYSDGALDKSAAMFRDIFQELAGRGLGLVEMNTQGGSFAMPFFEVKSAPLASAAAVMKSFAPESPALKIVERNIAQAEHTLILAQPSPGNIGQLKLWLEALQKRGYAIVPASAVAAAERK